MAIASIQPRFGGATFEVGRELGKWGLEWGRETEARGICSPPFNKSIPGAAEGPSGSIPFPGNGKGARAGGSPTTMGSAWQNPKKSGVRALSVPRGFWGKEALDAGTGRPMPSARSRSPVGTVARPTSLSPSPSNSGACPGCHRSSAGHRHHRHLPAQVRTARHGTARGWGVLLVPHQTPMGAWDGSMLDPNLSSIPGC